MVVFPASALRESNFRLPSALPCCKQSLLSDLCCANVDALLVLVCTTRRLALLMHQWTCGRICLPQLQSVCSRTINLKASKAPQLPAVASCMQWKSPSQTLHRPSDCPELRRGTGRPR